MAVMAVNYDRLFILLKECKLSKDFHPLIQFLQNILNKKLKLEIDVNEYLGQQYCIFLTDMLKELHPTNTEDISNGFLETICECLIHQVSSYNVHWYILERCQLLHCLSQQFLTNQIVSIKSKIANVFQNYLIHSPLEGRKLLSRESVSDLMKHLVNILRTNQHQDLHEASLGLLASLCQIWSHRQEVKNVIEDYQVLRKQLLRFLAAEMVKKTTIVYTMTIMFHLCNSDDRLFNKRNIRQTLQVLFNIMLNDERTWAPLYAVSLVTEICKSTRTCHLLVEYRSLQPSLKEIISHLDFKDTLMIEKNLELLLSVTKVNSDYLRMVTDIIMEEDFNDIDHNMEKDSNDQDKMKIPKISTSTLGNIIQLVNGSSIMTSIYSIRLLHEIYLELLSRDKDIRLPKLHSLSKVIHQFLSVDMNHSTPKMNIFSRDNSNEPATVSIKDCMKHRHHLVVLLRTKYVMDLVIDLLKLGDQWLEQTAVLIKYLDKILMDQLESNPLVSTACLPDNKMIFKFVSLGVDVSIEILYFYYRATEVNPSLNLFSERLKHHLEQQNCPIVLAFALSAASQNQATLQRALVLQGVCLHLPDFDVQMLGEKIYNFSTAFTTLRFCNFDQQLMSTIRKEQSPIETGEGDINLEEESKNHSIPSKSVRESDQIVTHQSCFLKGDDQANGDSGAKLSDYSLIENIHNVLSPSNIHKLDLNGKVKEIVGKWMEKPESSLTTAEIYTIFEHRIQFMQNQEALMEEIMSNKTAALYQSEALLNQYRTKLNDAEKECKQLRNIQVEIESKIDSLNQNMYFQAERIAELEKINQNLLDANRNSEKQREDQLSKLGNDNQYLKNTLADCHKQVEEAKRLISTKDYQVSNYIQMMRLINKLTDDVNPREDQNEKIALQNQLQLASPTLPNETNCCLSSSSSKISEGTCVNNNNDVFCPRNRDKEKVHHKRTSSHNDFHHLYKTNGNALQKLK